MTERTSKNYTETVHLENQEKKGIPITGHGMTGFDTNEAALPPGYFRSSFFIGTMYVLHETIFSIVRSSSDIGLGRRLLWDYSEVLLDLAMSRLSWATLTR